ncbi:AraC-like DNA-binding protein [Acinetobacter calcoaceticus]|uniref:AraC-like DNA-binding protein n=1 Tax=Acinetobacter calcoaceticus TaxID=471 RepID=A0A4R1XP91_ACICA|nr:AraC-like DNA-binding protein [Acinetobacter calcoaceticus]
MPADVRIRQPQYSKGTISMALVHEALRSAELQGINTELLLQHAGIALELTHAPKARVAVSAYAQLWIALADQLNDEFFGMDRHPMRRGSYQLISRLVMRSDHLEQAFRQILQFLNTVLDDIHSELQLEGGKAILILHDRAEIKPMFSYATYLMLVHGLLCWLADQRLNIEKIELKCAAPVDDQDYRVRFCEAIQYHAEQNRIVMDAEYLSIKIKHDQRSWYQFIQHTPQNLLIRFKNPHALSTRIRKHLIQVHPSEWLELHALAQRLNMSEATIQRRLKHEGISYQQLKNDIRRDTAIELLSKTDKPLIEISEQLNFHDPSAFHRAFKKWTGVSPGAYRNGLEQA